MTGRSLRLELRDATGEVHETLHHLPDFAALAEGRLSRDGHARLMQRMGGFYGMLDPLMIMASRGAEPYAYRPRAALFPGHGTGAVALPSLRSIEALAGAAYVVDGSVLGGQVLSRASAHAGSHPYWQWCCAHGATVWREALALIDRVDTGHEARQRAITAARDVFDAFHVWMAPAAVGAAR